MRALAEPAMKQPNVTVYGSRSCPDTVRATKFLDSRQIPYEFKDVDETPEYNDYIAGLNGGKRVTPTIRLDNETLINPSEQELGEAVHSAGEVRP
jgi:glutaredoxin